jgi:GT2 family glycosyltransferase
MDITKRTHATMRQQPALSSNMGANRIQTGSSFMRPGELLRFEYPAGDAASPGLCVVICTLHRPASVQALLESLAKQIRRPDEIVIVDASSDSLTEAVTDEFANKGGAGIRILYSRVQEPIKGLTRQRNHAVELTKRPLVAFFDDDTVLDKACLGQLEATHAAFGKEVAGVAAYIRNAYTVPSTIWRVRNTLRVVSSLQPGKYERSGVSIPWSFLPPGDGYCEGDWLPGCSMMWRTDVIRAVKFHESFGGYALGEDLDFSLRARREGKLLVARAALVDHFHEPSSRPNWFRMGYMETANLYSIHKRCLNKRNVQDVLWFVYAWFVDTVLIARGFMTRGSATDTGRRLIGRFRAGFDLFTLRVPVRS